jgi:hypothetical protein
MVCDGAKFRQAKTRFGAYCWLLVEVRSPARDDSWREQPYHPINVSELLGDFLMLFGW